MDYFKLLEYRSNLKEDIRTLHRSKRTLDTREVKEDIYKKELAIMYEIRRVEKEISEKNPYRRKRGPR